MGWFKALGSLLGIGGEYVKTKQEINKIKAKGKIDLAQTKVNASIERAKSDADSAGDLDRIALQNVGWKDEFLMIVITIPAILAFIPGMDKYVTDGFNALEKMPEYYQYALLGVYIYVFGFKRILLKVLHAFIEARFGKPKTTVIIDRSNEKKSPPMRKVIEDPEDF